MSNREILKLMHAMEINLNAIVDAVKETQNQLNKLDLDPSFESVIELNLPYQKAISQLTVAKAHISKNINELKSQITQ